MRASVIIPTLNRRKDLAECIESIFSCSQQSSLYEVVVIDNNSTDGTLESLRRLAEEDSRVKYTQIPERDAIKARNLGFNMASGDVIIHIDDDIVVDKEWLWNIIAPYTDETVGGVGGRLINLGQVPRPIHKHMVGKIAPWGQLVTNFDTQQRREVEFLHGSNMSFRRDLVTRVKGLDPNYKINWRDDTDLCIRIRKLGYRLLFQPTALVWHKGAGSVTRFTSRNKLYRYFWNREYFYYKNIFSVIHLPWSPIFVLSEAIFCVVLCARHSIFMYLGECFQGMREGAISGLRRNRSVDFANP